MTHPKLNLGTTIFLFCIQIVICLLVNKMYTLNLSNINRKPNKQNYVCWVGFA